MPIKDAQKTHTQHAVPQNIMDVEFKLIGDLTMRQFIYLFVFGVIAYIIYVSMVGVFKWPLTLFFVLLGLALAFVPIQERGMDEWFVNFLKAVHSPSQRVWKKESLLPPAFTYQNLAVVRQELITLAPTSSRRKLEEYLEIQQRTQVEDKLDIPEKEYILKVRQAFAPVITAVEVEEEEHVAEEYESFEAYEPFKQPVSPEPAEIIKPEVPKGIVPPVEEPKEEIKKPKVEEKVQPAPKVKRKPKKPKPLKIKTTIPDTFTFTSMTPDRHIGRKFTSMLPSEGQLILPVRGEKVLATSEELDIQKDIDDKTDQLRKLLDQITGDKEIGAVVIEEVEEAKDGKELSEAQGVVKSVKEENERLSNEIQKMKTEIEVSQESEVEKNRKRKLVEELEREKDKASTDYTALQRQVLDLQERLKEKEIPAPKDTGPKKPVYAKMQPITNEPNKVSGVIKDQDGEAIPGVVLLIKNHKGEAVRALKTNTLGQFSISTPLVKGMYTLEVGSSVEDISFDIITIEVKGEVLPPVEMIGRLV